MLYEIAITPCVFQTGTYGTRELCESEIRGIWPELFRSLVVRDLRSGDWHKQLWRNKTECPYLAQKALKALKVEKRLLSLPAALTETPTDSASWCNEALASHQLIPLHGILTSRAGKNVFPNENLVCEITQRLQYNSWWMRVIVGGQARVRRNSAGYMQALNLILRSANQLKFMDPHLDPSRAAYKDFQMILQAARRADGVHPKIEIHRVCYEGPANREIVPNEEWERRFRGALGPTLSTCGLNAEVIIWPDEHDRHLITNLGGIHLGNGFTVNNNPKSFSTWTPLPRNTSEDVERSFDPDRVTPHHRFKILPS